MSLICTAEIYNYYFVEDLRWLEKNFKMCNESVSDSYPDDLVQFVIQYRLYTIYSVQSIQSLFGFEGGSVEIYGWLYGILKTINIRQF